MQNVPSAKCSTWNTWAERGFGLDAYEPVMWLKVNLLRAKLGFGLGWMEKRFRGFWAEKAAFLS